MYANLHNSLVGIHTLQCAKCGQYFNTHCEDLEFCPECAIEAQNTAPDNEPTLTPKLTPEQHNRFPKGRW